MQHRWHIWRPSEISRGSEDPAVNSGTDLVLAISAARILVAHSGTLIFLDEAQQPIYALAPGAWTSVERVVPEEATNPAVTSGTTV